MTGIICINKGKDITSFGVCAKVRGMTREKKVGHTGTLDPMATGVLPVMLGGATRFLNYMTDSDKTYRASFVLGMTTDTLDVTGEVLTRSEVTAGAEDIAALLPEFRGVISQLPPMYSAVSVDGKRLYELARQGKSVERTPRQVEVKHLELVGENDGEYIIDVKCSKGTYIRTLIDDIGQRLGCGAVMTALVRTEAMGFTLDDCVTLEKLQELKESGEGFASVLRPLDAVLADYESVSVSASQAKRFSNGGALDLDRIKQRLDEKTYRVYSPDGAFLGLGEAKDNQLRAVKVFTDR